MKKIFTIVFLNIILSCQGSIPENSTTYSNGRPKGSLIGIAGFDSYIRPNFFKNSDFSLAYYFIDYRLAPLLGSYSHNGGSAVFKNGNPNTLNIHLWDKLIHGFSESLTNICDGETASNYKIGEYKEGALSVIKNICSDDFSIGDLESAWLLVMGYRAPYSEYVAWLNFYETSGADILRLPAKQRVYSVVKSIMLNPYFLLEH